MKEWNGKEVERGRREMERGEKRKEGKEFFSLSFFFSQPDRKGWRSRKAN